MNGEGKPTVLYSQESWVRFVVPASTVRKPISPNEVRMSLPVGTEEVFVRSDVLEAMLDKFAERLNEMLLSHDW